MTDRYFARYFARSGPDADAYTAHSTYTAARTYADCHYGPDAIVGRLSDRWRVEIGPHGVIRSRLAHRTSSPAWTPILTVRRPPTAARCDAATRYVLRGLR